jgi:hypothetical protein
MRRRYRRLINLCSLTLLSFSLYLNFIKKEAADPLKHNGFFNTAPATFSYKNTQASVAVKTSTQTTSVAK